MNNVNLEPGIFSAFLVMLIWYPVFFVHFFGNVYLEPGIFCTKSDFTNENFANFYKLIYWQLYINGIVIKYKKIIIKF